MQKWINIALVMLLGLFAIFIIFEFLQLNKQKQITTPAKVTPENSAQNLNQKSFENLKSQVTTASTDTKNEIESRFWGVNTSISRPSSGLKLELTGKQPPFVGKGVSYAYDSKSMPKVSAYHLQGEQEIAMTIADLKTGDEVYIYQKNDLNKTYPEGIVSVRVVKIN